MKFIFLTGGALGFTIAAAAGLWAGRPPDRVLLDASVGCFAGALLFRWYWGVWLGGVRSTYLARYAAAASAPSPGAPAAAPSRGAAAPAAPVRAHPASTPVPPSAGRQTAPAAIPRT